MRSVNVARGLVLLSAIGFGVTGLGYLVAPAAMLAVVGVPSAAVSDFLLRTEGVALVSAAGLLWAVRDGTNAQLRVALFALSVYYILGSIVDIAAYRESIVGTAAVPSAAVRIVVGIACLFTAARLPVPGGRW